MKKVVKTVLILIIIAGLISFGYSITMNILVKNRFLNDSDFADISIKNEDAIYFLNTSSSDAIILQSNGHYAMIDAGEDNDYPRGV